MTPEVHSDTVLSRMAQCLPCAHASAKQVNVFLSSFLVGQEGQPP